MDKKDVSAKEEEISVVKTSSGCRIRVDSDSLSVVAAHPWCISANGYAVSRVLGRVVYMHRLLLGPDCAGLDVDHINGDKTDNRRVNLRACTRQDNLRNSRPRNAKLYSKYKGVSKSRRDGCWVAQIWHDAKNVYLGRFASEADAAVAYDTAAIRLFGEFARVNGRVA